MYPALKNLSFPQVIEPGNHRDDLYITIDSAVITSELGSEKNIELLMCVRDENGTNVEGVICSGTGEKGNSFYFLKSTNHNFVLKTLSPSPLPNK